MHLPIIEYENHFRERDTKRTGCQLVLTEGHIKGEEDLFFRFKLFRAFGSLLKGWSRGCSFYSSFYRLSVLL